MPDRPPLPAWITAMAADYDPPPPPGLTGDAPTPPPEPAPDLARPAPPPAAPFVIEPPDWEQEAAEQAERGRQRQHHAR